MAVRADVFAYIFIAVFLVIVIAAIIVKKRMANKTVSTTITTTPVMAHYPSPSPPQIIVSHPTSPAVAVSMPGTYVA